MPNQIRDIASIDDKTYPYIFEQNVTVKLRSNSGVVRLNVYRPKGAEKAPVIMTYGPYGKDTPYEEYVYLIITDCMRLTNSDFLRIRSTT